MKYRSRIEQYLLQPLAIDLSWGLSQYYAFLNATTLKNDGSDLPKEVYRKAIEEREMKLYAASDFSLMPNSLLDNSSNANTPMIARVELKGTMLTEGGLCQTGIDSLCKDIEKAAANPNVIGILLNTHSGGGEVAAAQRLGNAINEAKKSKPVIQYVDGLAASGAYWAGACCDEIIAGGTTTQVGSIGVVIDVNKQMIDYINENQISIFADGSEGKRDVFKAILSGDHDFVKKNSLNPIRKEFVKIVKAGMPEVSEDAFSGSTFIARKAKSLGMVNSIGTREEAMQRLITLSRRRRRQASAKKALSNV